MAKNLKISMEIPEEFKTKIRGCKSCLEQGLGNVSIVDVKIVDKMAEVQCACGVEYSALYDVVYDPSGERTRVELLIDDEVFSKLDDYFIGRKNGI